MWKKYCCFCCLTSPLEEKDLENASRIAEEKKDLPFNDSIRNKFDDLYLDEFNCDLTPRNSPNGHSKLDYPLNTDKHKRPNPIITKKETVIELVEKNVNETNSRQNIVNDSDNIKNINNNRNESNMQEEINKINEIKKELKDYNNKIEENNEQLVEEINEKPLEINEKPLEINEKPLEVNEKIIDLKAKEVEDDSCFNRVKLNRKATISFEITNSDDETEIKLNDSSSDSSDYSTPKSVSPVNKIDPNLKISPNFEYLDSD